MKKLLLGLVLLLSSYTANSAATFPIEYFQALYPWWNGYKVVRSFADEDLFVITNYNMLNYKEAYWKLYLTGYQHSNNATGNFSRVHRYFIDPPKAVYSREHNNAIYRYTARLVGNKKQFTFAECANWYLDQSCVLSYKQYATY